MGSAQLSQVMTTVSKYENLFSGELPRLPEVLGIRPSILLYKLRLKTNLLLCILLHVFGMTELSSPQILETLLASVLL
jgi:hypothetical protein